MTEGMGTLETMRVEKELTIVKNVGVQASSTIIVLYSLAWSTVSP